MKQTAFILLISILLVSCYPTTPLLVAGAVGWQVAEVQTQVRRKAEECSLEDQDLIRPSIEAISQNRSSEVEEIFLKIHADTKNSDQVRAEALYQIGLIYMNRFNDQRDDEKAITYFKNILSEFPGLVLCDSVEEKLSLIDRRRNNLEEYSAQQRLIARRDILKKAFECSVLEEDLLGLSVEAISERKASMIEETYLAIYRDRKTTSREKAAALYQIGLIYMNEFNVDRDDVKARYYFEKILKEFPREPVCGDVTERMQELELRKRRSR